MENKTTVRPPPARPADRYPFRIRGPIFGQNTFLGRHVKWVYGIGLFIILSLGVTLLVLVVVKEYDTDDNED